MIAIIKNLFGGGKSNQDKGPAYYLDNDSAKSLGNIDYMRTAKSVKKSYPKAVGKLNLISGEVEESISAMEKKQGGMTDSTTPATPTTPSSSSSFGQSSTFSSSSTFRPRGSNSSMDSFREMARSMKKK
jgi:hypothetical protein